MAIISNYLQPLRPSTINRYSVTYRDHGLLESNLPQIYTSARSQSLVNPHLKNPYTHSYKFSSHYISRFYQDNSFEKAKKEKSVIKEYSQKKKDLEKRLLELKNNYQDHKLRIIEHEANKKLKKKAKGDVEALESRYIDAAVKIQKHVRGFLTVVKHPNEVRELNR